MRPILSGVGFSNKAGVQACGHKFSQKHQEIPFTGVVASSIPGLKFEPQAHVYCVDAGADTLKQYKDDGLPKFVQQVGIPFPYRDMWFSG